MERKAEINRKTKETEIKIYLNFDGKGEYKISTELPFFDHMLELFARHGGFDLEIRAKGDLDVDPHHTVEDIGLTLGSAVNQALGEKRGIKRYGHALIPMDEALCLFVLDISGRPHMAFKGNLKGRVGAFEADLVKDFFQAFSSESKTTIHIHLLSGRNLHHKIESIFKAFGKALKMAVSKDEQDKEIPSTKGII
ncbi:MAG: imidazoleglycerol-phosphate dehydratase HisB [Deltaproteobacteria bacterium]|nr:imidazoleglycerol-phosphate dehydratase HisB [Deltaproteobacteria bacterium]